MKPMYKEKKNVINLSQVLSMKLKPHYYINDFSRKKNESSFRYNDFSVKK